MTEARTPATTRAPLWLASEIGKALHSPTSDAWHADGVSIDSRTIEPGDLFVALKGERLDGHAFVAEALRKGAAAALVEERPNDAPKGAPLVVVEDTTKALADLARAARGRTEARIVAVTGSVGKSGTKEMLKLALGSAGPTSASEGSLNNHIGVPLSLARLPRDAAFGVFEVGMNHPGEIRPLAQLLKPHVGVITTIAPVHLKAFDSIEAIADAKAELFDGMVWNGYAVLNRDNAQFARLERAARLCGIRRFVTFGAASESDVRLVNYAPDARGGTLGVRAGGREFAYRLELAGRHWAENSLAVLAAAMALGVPLEPAAKALAALRAMKGRGGRHTIRLAGGDFELIDESYNASPASVRAALDVLGRAEGRRLAVLGDMLELGPDAPRFHADLAGAVEAAGVACVFAAGPLMGALYDALPESLRGGHAENSAALVPLVLDAIEPGDVVMVKGSAGSRMGVVVEALLALDNGDKRRAAGAA